MPTPDSLFGTVLFSKTKPLQKDVAAEKATADEELPPEQIQLRASPPVSPSLQSVDSDDDASVEAVSESADRPARESVVELEDADEGAVIEVEPGIGDDEWDNEETLVEIVAPGSLKEAALKIVEELCPETPIGKLDGLEVLESEVTPADQVVAQA